MRAAAVITGMILVGAGCVALQAADRPDPADLAREIRQKLQTHHPSAVLSEVVADRRKWSALLRGVESGNRLLMEVTAELSAGADAGYSEMIDLAFGEAIPRAPALVLRIAPEISGACGNLDDDKPYAQGLPSALAEVRRRMRAVQAVNAAALQHRKAECLAHLLHLSKALPGYYSEE
jgi:hypothetical protein